MARILIATHGTTGDLFPFLALGTELQRTGHDVRMVVDRSYRSLVEEHGLAALPVDTKRDEQQLLREGMEQLNGIRSPLKQIRFTMAELFAPVVKPFYDAICETAWDHDLIVSHAVLVAGLLAHRTTGVPLVIVMLTNMVPSAYYMPVPPPPFRSPPKSFRGPAARAVNRLMWKISEKFADWAIVADTNRRLAQQGLPAMRSVFEPLSAASLCLVAVSPELVSAEPDWPANCRLTGFLYNHGNLNWTPDRDLERFMEEGPKPIVITFGSMAGQDPQRWTRLLVDAVSASGHRKAVIQAGWGGLGRIPLPEHISAVEFVSHEWLLPRAACVVHHGGAGTSAAVLRAGVPSVVVTCYNDQFIWADALRRIGVCREVLRLQGLKPKQLGKAIARTIGSEALRARAREIGRRVAGETGVENARRAIEEMLEASPPAARGPAGRR